MARLIMVGEVEDAAAWGARFRSHEELFSTIYGPMGMNAIHFTSSEDNRFVLYCEVDDVDAWFGALESPEIEAAMAEDGVKRDTVRIHVLDKKLAW